MELVVEYAFEAILILAGAVGSFLYYNRKDIWKLKNRVSKLEQRLFGFEADSTDKGHVHEANRRLEGIERDLKNVEQDVKNIEHKVDYLVDEKYEENDD